MRIFGFRQKNCVKSGKNIFIPKRGSRSPDNRDNRDNRHAYLFCAMFIFDNIYFVGARFDYIKSNQIVTVGLGQYSIRARTIRLKISGNTYLATKLRCV